MGIARNSKLNILSQKCYKKASFWNGLEQICLRFMLHTGLGYLSSVFKGKTDKRKRDWSH